MTSDLKHNLKSTAIWLRGLYMLLFFAIYQIAEVVLGGVAVIQFLLVLATGRRNERLLVFGRQLSIYARQVFMFQTFNTESMPFPFAEWPQGDETPSDGSESAPDRKTEVAALELPPNGHGGQT